MAQLADVTISDIGLALVFLDDENERIKRRLENKRKQVQELLDEIQLLSNRQGQIEISIRALTKST